jgi:hypothetical protein
MPGRGRKQRPIRRFELRPLNLAAQNLELVTQHQKLDVLQIQAAATPNKCAKQSPEREVQEGEDHAADPLSVRPREATRILAPFRPASLSLGSPTGVNLTGSYEWRLRKVATTLTVVFG